MAASPPHAEPLPQVWRRVAAARGAGDVCRAVACPGSPRRPAQGIRVGAGLMRPRSHGVRSAPFASTGHKAR
jgi:hypothetical protein